LEVAMPITTPLERLADPPAVKAARRNLIDPHDAQRLAELLALLADATRARMLFALGAVDELCVGDLAATLEISEDAAGYALKVLRMAGLVRGRKAGRSVCYRLAEGFPHEMLEHCLRDLLAISPEAGPRIGS
jgi:ArsR family transcriptional regulator, lead/cadmium/zinc/bismuth-responsive transcriptional repressor